jgi:hypothetical protein
MKHTLRVFEKRVLRETRGPKTGHVTGEWIRLHQRSFMICTPQIKKRWVGNVANMNDSRCTCIVVVGKPKRRDHLGDSGVGGRIILKWLFRKEDWSAWTGLILLRIGANGGLL